MLIVCPSCTTAYRIELSTLGAGGRSVRCARCRNVWFASATEVAAIAMAPAQEPAFAAPARAGDFDIIDQPASEHAPVPREPSGAITDAPSLVPSQRPEPSAPEISATSSGPDIETLAARRERARAARKRRTWRMPSLPAIILLLVALLAALLNWRVTVVRYLPQTGTLFSAIGLPVNVRGLSFDGVKTSFETNDGVSVLAVEGKILNVAPRPLEVPRMRFAVRNANGYEVYAWTALPAEKVVNPGDAVPFRTRLAAPPADAEQVIVRFFRTTEDRGRTTE